MQTTTLLPQGVELLKRLVEAKALPSSHMADLEREMAAGDLPPADHLVYRKGLDRAVVMYHWSQVLGVDEVRLGKEIIDPDVTRDIPEAVARQLQLMPVFRRDRWLTVCMVDPLDVNAIDRIRFLTGLEVLSTVGLSLEISEAIAKFYSVNATMQVAFRDAQRAREADVLGHVDDNDDVIIMEEAASSSDAAPVIKIVNLVLNQALKDGASDIHIEPDDELVRVRFRIDGVLREQDNPPKSLYSAIVTRVKVLAHMDIAEKRAPQDGQFSVQFHGAAIDLRVNTLPTVRGEKIVIRILDKRSVLVGLDRSWMGRDVLQRWRQLIRLPGGLLLVTGPTGSGKTTTLYGSLSEISSIESNIVTVEDPVEYKLPIVAQVQVNNRADLSFAKGLRAILRQDPDVIMVGEIRDRETAEIAVRAALTGHLVLSTLHTNEAAETLVRLTDMGLEPYLIASSVRAVIAQRLVRRLCEHCREPDEPDPLLLRRLQSEVSSGQQYYRGRGCQRCGGSGFSGRIGVFELMVMSPAIRGLLLEGADSAQVRAKAREEGMRLLRDDGLEKARESLTTIEEIARVAATEG